MAYESRSTNRKRKLKRLIINVKVYDTDTVECIGYSANMHTQGMTLSSAEKIPVDKEYSIKIEHMEDDDAIEIPLHARCLWSKLGDNPAMFLSSQIQLKLEQLKI